MAAARRTRYCPRIKASSTGAYRMSTMEHTGRMWMRGIGRFGRGAVVEVDRPQLILRRTSQKAIPNAVVAIPSMINDSRIWNVQNRSAEWKRVTVW